MFKNVIVGVDARPSGRDAIALASQLVEPEGRLTFAHIYHDLGLSPWGAARMLTQDEPEEAQQLLQRERPRGQCGGCADRPAGTEPGARPP